MYRGEELTFSVVTEAHLGLAKANGIFARANSIEFLQLSLVNALVIGQPIVIPNKTSSSSRVECRKDSALPG